MNSNDNRKRGRGAIRLMRLLKINQWQASSAGRRLAAFASPFKDVRQTAFEPSQKVFQHFQGDVLLPHFHPLKR